MKKDNQAAWVQQIIQERNELFQLAASVNKLVPTWMLDALLTKGLDGDDPQSFPLLVNAFYKGHKNPMKKAYKVWNRYMAIN